MIAKNEGSYLLEWISYYLVLGFDRIIIYDNESTDNTRQIIQHAQLNDKRISYIFWSDIPDRAPMIPAYNDAVKRTNTEWIAFFDIDEFLVLKEDNSISEFLLKFDSSVSAIGINWLIFGSSNQENYRDDLVIQRFKRCSVPEFAPNKHIKTIARTKRIQHMYIHSAKISSGEYVNAEGKNIKIENLGRSDSICENIAQINHYVLKSKEEYKQKKIKGEGSHPPNSPKRSTKFTPEFWDHHDRNECTDNSIDRFIQPTIEMMEKLKSTEHLSLTEKLIFQISPIKKFYRRLKANISTYFIFIN